MENRKILTALYIEKYKDFFNALLYCYDGVLFQKQLTEIMPYSTLQKALKELEQVGLIKIKNLDRHNIVYLSQNSMFKKRLPADLVTASKIMRSTMKFEYLMSLGMKTFAEMFNYLKNGNMYSYYPAIHRDYLENKQNILRKLNFPKYNIAIKENENYLKQLAANNTFIEYIIKSEDEIIKPHLVYFNVYDLKDVKKMVKKLNMANEYIYYIFGVTPIITICNYYKYPDCKKDSIYSHLQRKQDFSLISSDKLRNTIKFLNLDLELKIPHALIKNLK